MSAFIPDLRIDLRPSVCTVVRPATWVERLRGCREVPLASGTGTGDTGALTTALDNLQRTRDRSEGLPWPCPAHLRVADEWIDHLLLPGRDLHRSSADEALARATHRFADQLGHEDSLVAVTPLPGSPDWLCAALDRERAEAWRVTLARCGLRLGDVRSALVDDLRAIAPRVRESEALLAFVREGGLRIVEVRDHRPVALDWLSLGPHEGALVELQLRRRLRDRAPERTGLTVYVQADSQALCRYRLDLRDPPVPVHANWRHAA